MGVQYLLAAQLLNTETHKEFIMAKPDPYADIDFEEINEATGLANDEVKCLKVCFDLFDTMKKELKDAFRIYDKEGQGFITNDTLRALIGELLAPLTDEELDGIIEELDEDGSGSMDFDEFCEMMM